MQIDTEQRLKLIRRFEKVSAFFGAVLTSKEVYVEISLLKRHGKGLRQIAAEVGCAVNTVRRHLDHAEMLKYERKVKRVGKLAEYESYPMSAPGIGEAVMDPCDVLYREISLKGYEGV